MTGDLLAHSIDLAQWLAGPIAQVTAMTETFIRERPLQDEPGTVMPVGIDDACAFLARFENGALGTFESTRYASGRKNQNTFEINGELGSIAFDLEDAHQLQYYDRADDALTRGFRTISVWDGDHPYMNHWWVPGCAIGYEHTFIHQLSDFLDGLEHGEKCVPDFPRRLCDAACVRCRAGVGADVGVGDGSGVAIVAGCRGHGSNGAIMSLSAFRREIGNRNGREPNSEEAAFDGPESGADCQCAGRVPRRDGGY